ncbi:MAG TPA: DUF6775 family putative metallopeptidase [bacterium]
MTELRFLHIYNGSRSSSLRLDRIADYLKDILPALEIDVRDEKILFSEMERTAKTFALLRVRDLMKRFVPEAPSEPEINYELKRLRDPSFTIWGILYEGFRLSDELSRSIPADESDPSHLHIYLTNQLLGSYDIGTRRYHARYAIYAFPCIASTTGMVVAPAKPKEYYMIKQKIKRFAEDEIFDTMVKEAFKGRFLEHDDERMNEVMKGVMLQCIFYHTTGDPFCENKNCRLYNAHWQEELLLSQTGAEAGLCKSHSRSLSSIFNLRAKGT